MNKPPSPVMNKPASPVMKTLLLMLVPCVAWAQAEPAPESYVPPNRPGVPQLHPPKPIPDSHLPKWHISVAPHLNFLLADVPGVPGIGYGAGVQVTRALIPIGLARFGVGADFAYDRFSHDRTTNVTTGTEFVAHATFAGLLVIDGIAGRIRPWGGVGGGFSVADYETPAVSSGSPGVNRVGVAGLVKVALGLGVRVWEGFDIGLRGDFDFTISGENLNGKSLFQPGLFSLGLDLGFRF